MARVRRDANAVGSEPVQADAKELTAREGEAEGVHTGVVNMKVGRPTEEAVAGGRPYPEEVRGSGFVGGSLANPKDFHGKITEDEGHEYTVGCGCRKCRIVRKG